MVTSTRGTRRALAILRSLGAGGGWISRAVHWQATLFTLVCTTVGVPLGFITGRLVFLAFARNMGTVDDAAIPFALIAVGVVAIVALANAATAVPARPPARRLGRRSSCARSECYAGGLTPGVTLRASRGRRRTPRGGG